MITQQQLENHALWLKTRYKSEPQGARLVMPGADLSRANLRGADLSRANLRGADLRGADLRGANLGGADLSRANLSYADLSRANLSRADLSRANLSRANLSCANLSRANLSCANLSEIESDLFEVLNSAPNEVAGLLEALRNGKIDGSTYEGECACLVGTIANLRSVGYAEMPDIGINSDRPAERWFLAIRPGHAPNNNPIAKITEEWILKWQTANPSPTSSREIIPSAIGSADSGDLIAPDRSSSGIDDL